MGMLYEYSSDDQAIILGKIRESLDREMYAALAGLVGLVQLLGGNPDINADARRSILTNHRFIEAQRVLGLVEQQS